jgi:hypothetical protein
MCIHRASTLTPRNSSSRKPANQSNVVPPLPFLKKPIKINFKGFFGSLSRAVLLAHGQEYSKAASELVGALASVNLSTSLEERAWLLLERGLKRAIIDIVADVDSLLPSASADEASLSEMVNDSLNEIEICLEDVFLKPATALKPITRLSSYFALWLRRHTLPATDSESVASRLPWYIASSLAREWADNFSVLNHFRISALRHSFRL